MSNWGIGLGAGVQSALQMYGAIQAGQRNALEIEKMEKEKADTAALDKAWAESQGRVGQQDEYSQAIKAGAGMTNAGTQQAQMLSNQGALPGNTAADQEFERASAEAAAGAMRRNAVSKGAIPEAQAALPVMKPSEYTADQGMKDYVKAASQVSRKGTLEAIQMKGVMRESNIQDKFDTEKQNLDDTLARIAGTAETGGLKGLYEAGKKEGLKLGFVEGKNGVGSRIQVLGPKGDVLETISDVASATQKLSDAAMNQFMTKSVGLLGSPDKVISALQSQKQVSLKEREVAAKEALIPSEIAKNQGVAGYYASGGRGTGKQDNLKARAQEYADILVESGQINPETKKPFTPAEAKKYSLGIALKAPESKGITANPDGTVIENGILYVPDGKGGYTPAKGLRSSPQNPVVAAFANFNPNAKKPVVSPRAIEIEANP
jgi:hypothetical protein